MNIRMHSTIFNCIIIVCIFLIILLLIFRLYKSAYNKNIFETFSSDSDTPKVAFLFLTYNNLKRSDIWNKFFGIDGGGEGEHEYTNKYTIYNHAKEPENITDILLKDKHIPEHIETCWGCPSLVEANILMIKEALKDPMNKKFILVSDSCIPIVSFNTFYKEIMKDDTNRINIHRNNNPERYDNIINPTFKKNEFTKHSGSGLVINLTGAKLLVSELDNYRNNWKNVTVPDEHYVGNTLRVLDPKFKDTLCLDKTTFDIWSKEILDSSKLDYNDDIVSDSYINIKKISNKGIDELRDKKFLLARKVDKGTEIDINYITI